ncbi:PhoX family protein [Leptothoe sp. PORK10 BA2]|uniref:PhoX family protein n=1 Tax=Leptothoe sp. PORK10 BA2 TaxID=3110254 RepID=UPI002B1F15AD|nr:PhoX family phosphatase [Leptothoe sp. PORK10 BA2]MEA5464107.1 PhoX family phosphatase [Leptothoe sp. PORK10 BA2]
MSHANHDNNTRNRSNNRPFEDILKASLSRRNVLKRSAVMSAAGFMGAFVGESLLAKGAAAATTLAGGATGGTLLAQTTGLLGFAAVKIADAIADPATPTVSPDYEYQALIPWGTSIQPGGPEYKGDPNTRPTAAEQANQVGIGHDGMWFFAKNGTSNTEGMLCINHEFGENAHILGKDAPESLEDVRLSQHAHGVSVVAIKSTNGKWDRVASPNSRRIHVNTEVEFSGPVAGNALLKNTANNRFQGTLNNCGNGYTPWGTYITCEENFNGYFGSSQGEAFVPNETQDRYGFSATGFGYSWELFDDRFDLSNPSYANEHHRFGWIVEIDPEDGSKKAVKRTAMGRFKHEACAFATGTGGRIVGYMGDDERFDYCYKYVSQASWRSMLARGLSPLDYGKLYVAKFKEDGSGEWLELTIRNPQLKAKFKDQAELLVFTRVAADILGATPMDRPEWTTIAPDGAIFWSLTNNSNRTETGPGSPLAPNPDGHILRMVDSNNHTGTKFTWTIPFIAQETHEDGDETTFSDPDALWSDEDGRLFIGTDGGQKKGLNNQMLVANPATGEIRRLFTGVASDEVTGFAYTPDRKTLFTNIQHPGDGDPTLTNFPAPTDGVTIPRDSTIVLTRKNGGIVGS